MTKPSNSNAPAVRISARHAARIVIVTQPGATDAESCAAEELTRWLGKVTGASFENCVIDSNVPESAIVVGPGPAAVNHFPGTDIQALGDEEFVIRTLDGRLLLAGGRPRGTLYAVYRFLQDVIGVRWYAPWCTEVPNRASLSVPDLDLRGKPAFEYREPFWYPAFDGDWAARNCVNSSGARLTERHGGRIKFKGFVHTFFPLVPPEQHFARHPEWYSMLDGKRVHKNAQLCCTNPELRDFIVERVKEWLRESPDADIVSVSQNDWAGACECPDCRAVDEREGTQAGSLLELVNYVAERIEPAFPHAAIETLAYQYTRKAPKNIRPRRNVIVRLCTIECDFRHPLEGATNTAFAQDNREWSRLTDRLYVWDYTTNFAYYMQPHPNWTVLGPNVRFFHRHGVRGLFEQGAHQSQGSEFAELRAWVLAQLMWNPYQDDEALINEFLDGYYGKPAAKHIKTYMWIMLWQSRNHYMNCFARASAPYLDCLSLTSAEAAWERAEEAARHNPDHLWRVRQARLWLWSAWLTRWTSLRREWRRTRWKWPMPVTRRELADLWLTRATEPGPDGWTPISTVRERLTSPAEFVALLGEEPPDPVAAGSHKPAPGGIEVQDNLAILYREPWGAEARYDALATDNVAVRIPGRGEQPRAFEAHVRRFPSEARIGRWIVTVWARIEPAPGAGPDTLAFEVGVGGLFGGPDVARIAVTLGETSEHEYRPFVVGVVDLNDAMQIWAASPGSPEIAYVWLDRITLERAK